MSEQDESLGTAPTYVREMVQGIVGEAMGFASLCWEPKPEGVFDSTTASAEVTRATDALMSMFAVEAELAFGIIANVSEGNWEHQPREWREAAARFRDRYHGILDTRRAKEPTDG